MECVSYIVRNHWQGIISKVFTFTKKYVSFKEIEIKETYIFPLVVRYIVEF